MTSCNSYIKSNKINLQNTNNNFNRKFSPNDLTSIKNDADYIEYDIAQSKGTGEYIFQNQNANNKETLINTATENVTVNFRDGLGRDTNNINTDSKVRYGKVKHERKHQKQLFERPFLSIPYTGRGELKVNEESFLLSSEDTFQQKQCNSLAGIYLENQFLPMVPNLKDNVQNTRNIIPEDSSRDWIRGGISTRNIVKDIDYFSKCNNDDLIKRALIEKKGIYNKN